MTPQNWQMMMTKKGRQFFFRKKIEVTPSVAAPGNTHPSDATVAAAVVVELVDFCEVGLTASVRVQS